MTIFDYTDSAYIEAQPERAFKIKLEKQFKKSIEILENKNDNDTKKECKKECSHCRYHYCI